MNISGTVMSYSQGLENAGNLISAPGCYPEVKKTCLRLDVSRYGIDATQEKPFCHLKANYGQDDKKLVYSYLHLNLAQTRYARSEN